MSEGMGWDTIHYDMYDVTIIARIVLRSSQSLKRKTPDVSLTRESWRVVSPNCSCHEFITSVVWVIVDDSACASSFVDAVNHDESSQWVYTFLGEEWVSIGFNVGAKHTVVYVILIARVICMILNLPENLEHESCIRSQTQLLMRLFDYVLIQLVCARERKVEATSECTLSRMFRKFFCTSK